MTGPLTALLAQARHELGLLALLRECVIVPCVGAVALILIGIGSGS
jgi:hypothetical protein